MRIAPVKPRTPTRAAFKTLALLLVLSGVGGCDRSDTAAHDTTSGATDAAPAVSAGSNPATAAPKALARGPSRAGVVGDRMGDANLEPVVMSAQPNPSPFRFTDVLQDSGIDFKHFSGMNADKNFPTANGSGVALLDYDGDGKLDVYFATQMLLPPGSPKSGPNKLYRNLGGGKFADATGKAGVGYQGFCHGAIAGDIDNDGDTDLFLCNYGPNVLYLNNGDGTFTDISKSAGVDVGRRHTARRNKDGTPAGPDDKETTEVEIPNWSSSGAFLDYDNDGDLDLYVSNYGEWHLPEDDIFCGDNVKGIRLYCSPRAIRFVKHLLYRNNGDHTFTDVYDKAILTKDPETGALKSRADGHGFGVVAADLNGDGRIDLYVANDMNPNYMFLNNGDGTFEDATESSGAAYDEKGVAQSGMGVDAEDVDGDGLPEIMVSNFNNEYNTLYLNMSKGSFMDSTPFFGMAADTTPWVGWGLALADFDNDGWPDNFVANGQVDDNRERLGEKTPYQEPSLLFANAAGKRFRLATRDAGQYFIDKHVARGAAFGDLDDDGDTDIVVNHKDAAPAVLRNDTKSDNHWVRLELRGTKSNRDAIGARVELVAGGRTLVRQRKGGCSMQSTNDPRLTVGVGAAPEVEKLTVRWPSGAVTTMGHLAVGRSYKIVEPDPAKPDPTP